MAAARSPALAASALLHGGLLVAALLSFRHLQQEPPPPPPPPLGESVPVSITTAAPVADVRPAVAAPEPASARSEAPEPAPAPPAPVESPAPPAPPPAPEPKPAPRPKPAPPAPAPPPKPAPAPPPKATPAPTPKPAPASKPKAPPAKPAPELDLNALAKRLPAERRPQKELDLSALAASLPRGARPQPQAALNLDALAASLPAGGRRAPAVQRGPDRAETAAQARPAVGAATGLSADVKGALRSKLIRLWTIDCEVDGADTVVARVRIRIGADGALAGSPELVSTSGDASAGVKAAAGQRALSAVQRGAPYTEVPAAQRATLNDFVFNFDARQACRNR